MRRGLTRVSIVEGERVLEPIGSPRLHPHPLPRDARVRSLETVSPISQDPLLIVQSTSRPKLLVNRVTIAASLAPHGRHD